MQIEDGGITISVQDHKSRCRLCWRLIGGSEVFYKTNERIKVNFETLTSLELPLETDQFSSMVCFECYSNLKKFSSFRSNLIRKQTKLSLFLLGTEKDELIEFVGTSSDDDEQRVDQQFSDNYDFIDEEITDEVDILDQKEKTSLEESEAIDKASCEEIESLIDDDHIEVIYDDDDETSTIYEFREYTSSPAPSEMSRNISRKRVHHWNYTHEMELDLIRYQRRYSYHKTSEASMYEKISGKFKAKNYPPISAKSLKFKFKQIRKDKEKLHKLQRESQECEDSNDEMYLSIDKETTQSKGKRAAKSNTVWSEHMEVLLLYFAQKFQKQQPGISFNDLMKSVTTAMNTEGQQVSFCIVRYRFKKINLETEKLDKLMSKVTKLEKEREKSSDSEERLAILDLPNVGRNLHWSDEMKMKLITYRDEAKSQVKKSHIWNVVAERMKSDGLGTFTRQKLLSKYSNLMREAKWKEYASVVEKNRIKSSIEDF